MYRTPDGQQVFVVDSHVHFWDGSPANQKNRYAEGWVECFYNYHKNLSPADYVWPLEQYQRYSEQQMMKDLFEEGYVDVAIFPADVSEGLLHERLEHHRTGRRPQEQIPRQVHPQRRLGPARQRQGTQAARRKTPSAST